MKNMSVIWGGRDNSMDAFKYTAGEICLRFLLIVFILLPCKAFPQILLSNGQYAGTLQGGTGVSPVSYFVSEKQDVDEIAEWLNVPENEALVHVSSSVYDNFIIVSHPNGIISGKINQKISSFIGIETISKFNKILPNAFRFSKFCVVLPASVSKDGIRKNIMIVYIMSQDEQRYCLGEAFSLVSGVDQ